MLYKDNWHMQKSFGVDSIIDIKYTGMIVLITVDQLYFCKIIQSKTDIQLKLNFVVDNIQASTRQIKSATKY